MGLDRDPGTLDFFEAGIVLLHWIQAQGPAQKKGRGGREKREREKRRGSLWTV